MASKVERLRATIRGMREKGEVIAKNTLHAGETLVVGSAVAYAEGRLSDANGEWGYKEVPYAYMGGAVLFLTGLFAGERYGADFFAAGSGAVGAHLFRSLYETGLKSKQEGPQGRRSIRGRVGMGLPSGGVPSGVPQGAQQQSVPRQYGTALDGLRGAA